MLHEFLSAQRTLLIDRCSIKVAARSPARANGHPTVHGIPVFLDQLITTLEAEHASEAVLSLQVSGPSGGGPALSDIGTTATRHARELLQHGYSVDQVVHDYGDLCQAITEVASECRVPIGVDEFRTLNRCLDNAIAEAVMEFGLLRERSAAEKQLLSCNERIGTLAHELRNQLQTATLTLAVIKAGQVGVAGATGSVLDRSLLAMRKLIDRELTDVRVTAALPARRELFALSTFVADLQLSESLLAESFGCTFTVAGVVDATLALHADRGMLLAAVGNLLHNAFKFTILHTGVTLEAYATADRIRIDVADHCGGLPPIEAEKLFLPFVQASLNKLGVGLGLSICRRTVEANDGVLSVVDRPGLGCVFTIDLPRHALGSPPLDQTTAEVGRLVLQT
ncbi:MAG: HAMP domain-containing sensor histidine kinase [Casimicrobiaceae bacterium]